LIIESSRLAKGVNYGSIRKGFTGNLRQLGYDGEFDAIGMKSWGSASGALANTAIPNKHFTKLGLFDPGAVQSGIPVSIT
jgi:hypothetical protein